MYRIIFVYLRMKYFIFNGNIKQRGTFMLKLGNNDNYASFVYKFKKTERKIAKTVYREILDNNKDRMNLTALIFNGKEISFNELFKEADKVADILASYGIKKGDMIPLCINGTPQTVSLLLACSKM